MISEYEALLMRCSPLKSWMKEHGMNPYPKARQSKPTGKNTSVFHRDIQTFQFDSFTGSPSNSPVPEASTPSRLPSRGSSALDQLFTKFIHKQEEEIMTPSRATALGSDNNAGLERLFGGLNVLQEEGDALRQRQQTEEEMRKKEDDALARLLGGVGGTTPQQEAPQPQPQSQVKTAKQTNLLAMLNQKPSEARSSAKSQASTQTQTQTQVQPHHNKLLSLLSPHAPPPSLQTNIAALSDSDAAAEIKASDAGAVATTSPPSARSASGIKNETGETDRQARARALLDMTVAGIGASPATATATASVPTTAVMVANAKAQTVGGQDKQVSSLPPLGSM